MTPANNQFYQRAVSKASMYVVLTGSVTISIGNGETGEETESAMLKPGDSFGMERMVEKEDVEPTVVLSAQALGVATLLWMRPSLYNSFIEVGAT